MASDLDTLPVRAVPRDGPIGETVFSICTLATRSDEYAGMVESFLDAGFDRQRTEYLFGDNRAGNAFDGFSGLTRLIAAAKGRYVLLVHQDVRAGPDDADTLLDRLSELEGIAPDWAVAGNAGRAGESYHLHITDPLGADRRLGSLPAVVESLDENFLVVRRETLVAPSRDLAGFHLYGLDLAENARSRGYAACAIDFHVVHDSLGRIDPSYIDAIDSFERKKAREMQPRAVHTLILPVVLSASRLSRLRWARLLHTRRRDLARLLRENAARSGDNEKRGDH